MKGRSPAAARRRAPRGGPGPARPVALLTDFGSDDPYVGVLKAVILGLSPGSPIIDLGHGVSPGAVDEASFLLAQAFRYLPAGTVVCAVCDPGVGTGRRAVALAAAGRWLVGPDNGIFTDVLRESPAGRALAIDRESSALGPRAAPPPAAFERPSPTFEGRDVFAPVAARLARDGRPGRWGRPFDPSSLVLLPADPHRVVHVDRFGNLVTGLRAADLPALPAALRVEGRDVRRFVRTYGDAAAGEVFGLVGSSGHIEVSVAGGSAAEALGVSRGARVELVSPLPREAGERVAPKGPGEGA